MRISDWSSDVCSSDLLDRARRVAADAVAVALQVIGVAGIVEIIDVIAIVEDVDHIDTKPDLRFVGHEVQREVFREREVELAQTPAITVAVGFVRDHAEERGVGADERREIRRRGDLKLTRQDRTSVVKGKSVSVRVVPGGRRNIKKKKNKNIK